MRPLQILLVVVGLALLAPGMARAQGSYKVQPIVKLGDKVGDLTIKADGDLEIGTLNDQGQIVFVTENANPEGSEFLFQYADGQMIPLVVAGRDAPGGKWSQGAGINSPVSMNQAGNIVFSSQLTTSSGTGLATFLWDYKARKLTPIALKGMPADAGRVFEQAGGFSSKINNAGEIVLVATVKNAAGQEQPGVFFLGRDGAMQPVAVPDQALPGGGKVLGAFHPVLNEAGVVALLVTREGESQPSAYLWRNKSLSPVATLESDAPGGGKFASVTGVWVNNKNDNLLFTARVDDADKGPTGLYMLAGGKLTPVLAPGQELPGGGKFKEFQFPFGLYNVSFANDAGQHAILATLEDGAHAAYLMQPDGTLSLIMKDGAKTDASTITRVGAWEASVGIGLNNNGQVALTARIDNGIDTIVLLTPQ